jgi:hypothetical protein
MNHEYSATPVSAEQYNELIDRVREANETALTSFARAQQSDANVRLLKEQYDALREKYIAILEDFNVHLIDRLNE